MIIAVDIETQGLDATKFILGCLITERNKKPEYYYKKEELWKRILELGEKERKRGKTLQVYSHNASYDFYGYANLKDKKIKWYSHRPFIVSREKEGKEYIKFLDTLSIYRMPLKELGKKIGLPKLETPEKLMKEEGTYTPFEIEMLKTYCKRDTEIVLKSILKLKKKLKEEGCTVKRLYTINQIAINNMINYWRKRPEYHHIFWNHKTGETRRTLRAEEIHEAYRGGRVEAWKLGTTENVTYIDYNSLYPDSARKMKFPDLGTEKKIWKPKEVPNKIGITRCMIENKSNKIGLLPVRTKTGNYYPKRMKYLVGTWTNKELKLAEKEGYKILKIEWSVIYEEAPNNPLKTYFEESYKRRLNTKEPLSNYLEKSKMNCGLGKLAQTRTGQEIVIDSVEKAKEYIEKGWEQIKGIEYDYMYKNKKVSKKRKKYYTPIIPTLVNAEARIRMYKEFKKFKKENLIYTDTDSIIFKGKIPENIKVGNKMGEFKIESEGKSITVYGRKTYMIGKTAKISGIRKRDIRRGEFDKGIIKNRKMITINTSQKIEDMGKFEEETRKKWIPKVDEYKKEEEIIGRPIKKKVSWKATDEEIEKMCEKCEEVI